MRTYAAVRGRGLDAIVVVGLASMIATSVACGGASEVGDERTPTQPEVEGTSSPPTAQEPPPGATEVVAARVDTLYRSQSSGIAERLRDVVRSETSWGDAWDRITAPIDPAPPAPAVDFATQRVLVLAMGTRTSGGYSIELGPIAEAADTLYVGVREHSPGNGCVTTLALTQPVLVVAVDFEGDAVEFLEDAVTSDCG